MDTLDQLKKKEKGIILSLKVEGDLKKRFLEMGLVKGALVELIKYAPLGDPMEIRIKGYSLSIRKSEAKKIYIKRL
ncbi:MAG TPA: ferrous iron transport protein A [Chlamydiales bacterium]|nr:ferrous iron transport protein A [Chlamydiales bacterium]